MIYDKLSNAKLYMGLSPLLQKAFNFISSGHNFHVEVDNQWRELQGSDLYYKVTDIVTSDSAPEEYRYEYHHRYADIHYIISGSEDIALADLSRLKLDGSFDIKNDCGFAKSAQTGIIHMRPNDFMICFPDDGHRCWIGDGHVVRKVLFKVLLDSF